MKITIVFFAVFNQFLNLRSTIIASVFIMFSMNAHSLPADAPFDDDPTNLYHIFSDVHDYGGAYKWCESYVELEDADGDDHLSGLAGCSPAGMGQQGISCDYFIRNTINTTTLCLLEFRCIYQDGPNEGEWNLNLAPTPGAAAYCAGSVEPPKNWGSCPNSEPVPLTPNPIHIGIGNKFLTETDYQSNVPGGLNFRRYYNSQATQEERNFGMAVGWRADYFQYVEMFVEGRTLEVNRPDGKRVRFYKTGSGVLEPFGTDVIIKALELIDGTGATTGWRLTLEDDSVEEYDANGRLLSIMNRAGLTQTLDYDVTTVNGGDDNPLTLDKVTDYFGRSLRFTYHAVLVINTMTDPDGGVYTFGYGASADGQLIMTGMTYPDDSPADPNDNPMRQYHYEDINNPLHVTGITDETGSRYSNYAYDSQGRAIMSELANGIERMDVVYNADGTTTVTDSEGQARTYHFENIHGVVKVSQVDGGPCSNCGSQSKSTTYDANGFVSSRINFNGNQTTFINNSRGLETSRTEAVSTAEERTIITEWHPTFRLPTKITEPGKITDFTYDAQGQLLERTEETAP